MPFAVPLSVAQIDAAGRIRAHMGEWIRSDEALAVLRARLPTFEPATVLLKVVAVSTLYGAKLWTPVRMAEHVVRVLTGIDVTKAGPELVETIAALPAASAAEKPKRHRSFASKFAHFFLDAERFPILDRYADAMARLHLGDAAVREPERPYAAFAANFRRLMGEAAGWRGSSRALDRYLWVAGLYREWRKNPEAPINAEARRLFESPPPTVECDLATLLDEREET